MPKVKSRALKAAIITASWHFYSQFARLVSNLILTRLLVPEMFGVMSIAMLVIMAASMLSDVGTRQYIIQAEHVGDQELLDTVWLVQIIRGVVVFFIVAFIAIGLFLLGHVGVFTGDSAYADKQLPIILGSLSVLPIISGLLSTKSHVLNRNLKVGYIAGLEIVSQTLGIFVMIYIAWHTHTIWALIAGVIFTESFKTIASHFFYPGKMNKFSWDSVELNKIFNFSKWIFLSSIFSFLSNSAHRLWLGGLISVERLGVFTIALLLAMAVNQLVGRLSSIVLLPALSNVSRERPEQISFSYYKARVRIDFLMMFTAGFLFLAGPDLVDLLYDERYQEAGRMLRILSAALVVRSFWQGEQCLMALGHVRVRASIIALNAIILNTSIPVAFFVFGLYGALIAFVVGPLVATAYLFYELRKLSVLNLLHEIRMLPVVFLGALTGYIFSQILDQWLVY